MIIFDKVQFASYNDPVFDGYRSFENLDLKGKTLVQALGVAMEKAESLCEMINLKYDSKRIPSYRYNQQGEFESTFQSEDDVTKSINKSIVMFEYDHAVTNLVLAVNFYKGAAQKTDFYKAYFLFIKQIFKKFKEIQDVVEGYEKKLFEIDRLQAEILELQKINASLVKQAKVSADKARKFENRFKNAFLNERVLRFFTTFVDTKIIRSQEGYTAFQLISRLVNEGRLEIKSLAIEMGVKEKDIKELVKPYNEIFVILENKYLDLNFAIDDIKKDKLITEYSDFIKKLGLDGIPDVDEEEKKLEAAIEVIETSSEIKEEVPEPDEENSSKDIIQE